MTLSIGELRGAPTGTLHTWNIMSTTITNDTISSDITSYNGTSVHFSDRIALQCMFIRKKKKI